jgi:hypothetical protein
MVFIKLQADTVALMLLFMVLWFEKVLIRGNALKEGRVSHKAARLFKSSNMTLEISSHQL